MSILDRVLARAIAGTFAGCLLASAASADERIDRARAFVRTVVDEGVLELTGSQISQTERQRRFRDFLAKYLDPVAAKQSLLGRYLKTATPEEGESFISLAEEYVVIAYVSQFENFSPTERIEMGTGEMRGDNIVVHTQSIDPNDPPPTAVDWTVIVAPDGAMKVADVSIDGVSAMTTLRSDFTAAIRAGGGSVAALLTALQNKIKSYVAAK